MKRFYALLCAALLLLCLCPAQAFASGQGNLDGGGGNMNQGTSTNFWSPGNDGVRVTVVDAQSGSAVSTPVDFSNRSQSSTMLHFGKVNKIQYRDGTSLSLQSGVPYNCLQPAYSMPTIINSNSRPASIEAIKRYFCSEYACMMVADATGVSYENMLAGQYKILLEPIAYVTFNGTKYAFTATEAALYDQLSGGSLRSKLPSVAFQNLPLALFLEYSDLGFPAWTGGRRGIQSNGDIISSLGVGIVWFEESEDAGGEIEAPDVEYRVDTDVITAIRLRTNGRLTPDNPATVTFHIMGRSYTVRNIVIPANDSQLVWVKWHTPNTPQTITITVTLSRGFTAQDTFVAKIVDLNEKIPPDPLATDVNPGYSVPSLPVNPQKLSASWGVWSCYWVPDWQWCSHGEDDGHWVDRGDWEYDYTGYSASITGAMALMPDDIVPTANGKDMKSGYGVKTEVRSTLSTNSPDGHHSNPQTAFSVFPEFQYKTYLRLLQRVSSGRSAGFTFQPNEFSTYGRTVHVGHPSHCFRPCRLYFPGSRAEAERGAVLPPLRAVPDGREPGRYPGGVFLTARLLHGRQQAVHISKEVTIMSLSINDARVFGAALKKARKKKHLTQAQCAELLDHSVSFQKDLERCRCSPSIENFYHICRMLNISADDCIFQDSHDRTGSTYQELLRLLPLCDEKALFVLVATASALTESAAPSDAETGKT